ncbi:hypothetical protein SODALDRAFT_330698 [Sodiomyces alkalinus F11]|uniref:Uncharacterized protein n=1 Tax=Sodiomyces alkalinus (strain CBS 110278 / VKM F-3762 / F11) TaxID=1314773 RepID=A0A3N2Q2L6_SODAK|nr:hypothetical protein SODALDRAFT_330698 [Sodiomyces alkalinus F11]ROT40977.1 hypothetical protein SODALDRAFT_330698 [Sodiomyces alkalinus F11]
MLSVKEKDKDHMCRLGGMGKGELNRAKAKDLLVSSSGCQLRGGALPWFPEMHKDSDESKRCTRREFSLRMVHEKLADYQVNDRQ